MAMSLEELLAKEGFKGRRSKMLARASFASEGTSVPHYAYQDRRKSISSSGVKKPERTQSDIPWHGSRDELPKSDRTKGRRLRDNLTRNEILDKEFKKDTREKIERVSNDYYDFNRFSFASSKDFRDNEIVEVGVEDGDGYKDIYSNKVYSPERSKDKYSDELGDRERPKRRSGKDIERDKRYGSNSNKHMLGRMSTSDSYQKSMKQPETSYGRDNRSSQNGKNFDNSRSQRHSEVEQNVAEPALDEVAVRAMISILSGYIKRFLNDEDFRTLLHHNYFTVLNLVDLDEDLIAESKVIGNLEQAIETVERAAEDRTNANELKKASLQLSVITGLNSNDLKDEFTSGIPNSKLSACAHLYLSVIYKLQKKDRIAAKHLLQVFCDSPFQARTALLPELWEHIFHPHLSHLKVWYDQEADSLADTPNKARKLKLLQKVYNEILDSGTYQFAVYYKDWLTEGVEAPSIPSIHVPSMSVQGVDQGGLQNYSIQGVHEEGPTNPFSPQPMVSKKLYDAVFGRLQKPGANKVEDTSVRSSDSSPVEDKQTLTFSSAKVKNMDHDIERDNSCHHENGLIAEEGWSSSDLYPENPENIQILHALPHTKPNELTLQRLAKSVFEVQQTEGPLNLTSSSFVSHTEDVPYPDSFANSIKMRSFYEELNGNRGNFDEEPSCSTIPQDFICPLTGLLYEDPVTLETGQTFERAAITEWFNQGHKTCPVTRKTLECQSVPRTNFILKRVIDSWKSENCRHLLVFSSQAAGQHISKLKDERGIFILEQLLTAYSDEERIKNAKFLISLGGLQFLIRRFESGNLEEKTRVAALLSFCIEADNSCRNYIAGNIKKSYLLELIHSKQVKSRANAVLLLTELICMNKRKDVNLFLSGLQNEGILDTMHVLLVYLQSSPPEERPLVAVLLLHLDLLVEPRKYSIYREEAVNSISVALDGSLSDEKIQAKCCRALLILGGRFSSSGKIMTEDWILKQTGFLDGPDRNSLENEENVVVDGIIASYDEEEEREEWLRSLSASLIGDGKNSFLESISKCLGSGRLGLVRVCLTTVAWLSSALAAQSNAEFQLSAFSALISRLKDKLENGERVEHKILASMSLLNFSRIPECRVLLMSISEELAVPLRSLAEVTWTAKELYAIVSGEDP
ncbi:E3 ubiquitin-protein like [Actinidia chinensis var. chinensis]|uniref:RING-type E3 ubiquitin transferase n=1 Tax=Actinidia chinensis var. chinensis TaxID=1590841 RepID=A0A2R6P8E6_ACTCC|nr:E3 ubiquitin-protein like [Actinidia chinensis var. chinensis]